MANIAIPNTAVDGTLITAAAYNQNLNEIQTKYNAGAVQTDVAKTISVLHTLTAGLTISGGLLTAQAIAGTTGQFAATNTDAVNINAAGAFSGYRITVGAQAWGYRATASQMALSDVNASTDRLTVNTAGTVALSTAVTTSAGAGDLVVPNTKGLRGVNAAASDTKALIALNASDKVLVDGGALGTVTGGSLTVTSGGAAITGNSSVTGNITLSGQLLAAGLNVAQPTDISQTTITPANTSLSIAVGANQTWRMDFDMAVACSAAGGVNLQLSVPAGTTGRKSYMGATTATTATFNGSDTVIAGVGTAWAAFASTTQNVYVRYSVYLATAAAAGNVVMQYSAVTAGQTATFYTGSTVLATRIS